MKRRIVTLSIVIIILAILSFGTLSYRVTYKTSENVITAGDVNAVIHNQMSDGTPAETTVVCMPGQVIDRIVTVENKGSQPFYVRIELKKYVENSDMSAAQCFNMNFNEQDWVYQDGYFYYLTALQPGKTTEPLFTQVEVDGKNVDNAYLGKVLKLDVSAYAVQSQNNGQTVWDAMGWPKS